MTRAASLLLALLLALGLAGCGDDSDKGDEGGSGDQGSTASPEPGDDDTAADDADDAADDAAPAVPPVFTDGPGDATLTFSGGEEQLGAGEFDQAELTISVGQVVEFVAGDGGTYAVKVGGLDGVTIHGGLKEYYRFDAAGRYPVEEDLSGATATIIVE